MSFHASLGFSGTSAIVRLAGDLTDAEVAEVRSLIDEAVRVAPRHLVVDVVELTSLVPAALRCLAFAQQLLPSGAQMTVDGASQKVTERLRMAGLERSVRLIPAVPGPFAAAA
ncbi:MULTISPECIES: STAS domain-containing protein [unclassified Streptomyces]|uniref:STAS domain-containing protein n=1 Tax=unclassified Streptomyces TaxID=2593676 RepID=UPI003827F50B